MNDLIKPKYCENSDKGPWVVIIILAILSSILSMCFNLYLFKNPIPVIIGAYFVFLYGYRNRFKIFRMIIAFILVFTLFCSLISELPPWSSGIAFDMHDKGYTNMLSWNEYKSEANSLINLKMNYIKINRIEMLSSHVGIILIDDSEYVLYNFKTNEKLDSIDRLEIKNAVKVDLDSNVKIEAGKLFVWKEDKFVEYVVEYKDDFIFSPKS